MRLKSIGNFLRKPNINFQMIFQKCAGKRDNTIYVQWRIINLLEILIVINPQGFINHIPFQIILHIRTNIEIALHFNEILDI